jgi:hypothetical protein
LLLQGQALVVDVASAASKTAHLALLFARGPQLEFEPLPTFHGGMIICPTNKKQRVSTGQTRHLP